MSLSEKIELAIFRFISKGVGSQSFGPQQVTKLTEEIMTVIREHETAHSLLEAVWEKKEEPDGSS